MGSNSFEGVGLAVTVGVRGWLSSARLGYFHFVSLLGPQAWEEPHVHTLMLGISPSDESFQEVHLLNNILQPPVSQQSA